MKTKKLTLAVVMAALFLASCTNGDLAPRQNSGVRFTGDVENVAGATRVNGTTWAEGDAIGVFMVVHGTRAVAEKTANREYVTKGNGTFAAAGDAISYPMDGSMVDFIAYYPYAERTELGNINVVLGNQNNQPSFDLMWAVADNSGAGYNKGAKGAVPLEFEHKLARIVMNTVAGTGLGEPLEGMTVRIENMYTRGVFNLATGTFGMPDTAADITPHTAKDGEQYDAIIMPGSYNAGVVKVRFTTGGGDTFTWTMDAETFEGGNEYVYTVGLSRTGVTATATITPWNTIPKGAVTAE
jgi:hypothetical protein